MNILLLTQVLPFPPDSGPKIKTWNLIKYLSSRHNLTLASFVRGDQSLEVQHLRKYCSSVHVVPMKRGLLRDAWHMLLSLLRRKPFLIVRDERLAMHRLVSRLVGESDFAVIHADQINMAQYAARVSRVPKVLDAHNALWLLYERLWKTMKAGPKKWLLAREWRLLKRYEGVICREFDAVLAVSEVDKRALKEATGTPTDITVIPIAIDTTDVPETSLPSDANHVLYVGTMFWPPNIDGVLWLLRKVWPHVRAQRPDVTIDVVGAKPPRTILRFDDGDSGVNVRGYVEDLGPLIRRAGVMVVPLRAGGGLRVKILQGLAQGLPIVSTSIGCEGIPVEHGRHLLVADTPHDFARATLQVLEDRKLAGAMARTGRELIRSRYDYRLALQSLDGIYQSMEFERQ